MVEAVNYLKSIQARGLSSLLQYFQQNYYTIQICDSLLISLTTFAWKEVPKTLY